MATFEKFVNIGQFEEEAEKRLPGNVRATLVGTLERGTTYATCNDDFARIRLRPRALKDVSDIDLSTTLLGEMIAFPIGVSPTASHLLFSKGGEISTAKACSSMDTCMILSSASDRPMAEVSKELIRGLGWMQMYIFKQRSGVLWLVREAERCGFKALVVTVDQCIVPWGRIAYGGVKRVDTNLNDAGLSQYPEDRIDDSLTWDDFAWLVMNTRLPVVAKGIMSAEDAVLAVNHGAAGVLVSNHGGRLLDGVPSTISVLPEVVAAVGDKIEVYLDSGVRYGSDVLKAMALGARAVFVGRPALWGLTCGDETGVQKVLTILKNQFKTSIALTGCRTLRDINDSLLWKGKPSNL